MQLILDEYGISLEKNENMFLITQGEQSRSISPVKVTAIHIFKTATLSTAALLMAAEHDIPVLVYDSHYKPAIRLWKSNFTSTGAVRVIQPVFCESTGCIDWCRKLLINKLSGQLHHISIIKNRWPGQLQNCAPAEEQIKKSIDKIDSFQNTSEILPSIRGLEGIATAAYWKLLQDLLNAEVFKKREQQQPGDKFNPCINYLYGILYGKVEGALLAYGLDPMVGMMHAEGYNKKSLVYDCIEPFRHWAEILVVQLFKDKTLQSAHFEYRTGQQGPVPLNADDTEQLSTAELQTDPDNPQRPVEAGYPAAEIRLAKQGRRILAEQFIKMLHEKTVMNNRRISRNDQVYFLCSQLAQAIKNFQPAKKEKL